MTFVTFIPLPYCHMWDLQWDAELLCGPANSFKPCASGQSAVPGLRGRLPCWGYATLSSRSSGRGGGGGELPPLEGVAYELGPRAPRGGARASRGRRLRLLPPPPQGGWGVRLRGSVVGSPLARLTHAVCKVGGGAGVPRAQRREVVEVGGHFL